MNHVRAARFVGDGRFHHLWQVGCRRIRNFARIGRGLPGASVYSLTRKGSKAKVGGSV